MRLIEDIPGGRPAMGRKADNARRPTILIGEGNFSVPLGFVVRDAVKILMIVEGIQVIC